MPALERRMLFIREKPGTVKWTTLRECPSDAALVNPGRGWYHIYTFRIGRPDEEALRWLPFYDGETLALLRLDISDFREERLSGTALMYLRKIFEVFRAHKKELLLRFCYDTEGKGLLREPSSFGMVLTHIRQLGELAAEYAPFVCVAQGLLIGSWGEMHSSRYLAPAQLSAMEQSWREATGGSVRLSLRKPVFLRLLEGEPCAGLYDDAIFGSETDLGTFGEKPRREAGREESWQRQDELACLRGRAFRIPCGGETVAGLSLTPEETIRGLRQLQLTYLNSVHDPARLEEWRSQRLPSGESLYDYIGAHMGYRLVVTGVRKKRGLLQVCIANTGFAPICDRVLLYAEGEGGRETADCDLTGLFPGKSLTVETALPGNGRLALGLLREKDQAVIRFANEGAGEQLLLRDG